MYPNPFPKSGSGDVQIFNNPSTSVDQWHTWNKPKGCSLVYILCIGGGGGGGCDVNNSGAGGGGASGTTRVLIPASLLPDRLYIQVGAGGVGAPTTGGTGSSGVLSYVSIAPSATITASNIVAVSGTAAATGGQASNTNGAGSTAATIANMPLAGLGRFQAIVGQAGAVGGVDIAIPTTSTVIMGGGSGVGYNGGNNAGKAVTAITNSLISQMRPIAAGVSGDGSGSYIGGGLFFVLAALGGGNATGGPYGAGGNGKFGSGGAGGGGGTASAGGRGGDGGSGLVLIISA